MSLPSKKIGSTKGKSLTNDRIEKLKVGNQDPTTRRIVTNNQKISDSSGLFVQVSKTGKKTFRYKYYSLEERNSKGIPKDKVVTIGTFSLNGDGIDSFTIEQARSKHRSEIALLKREGTDPQDKKIEEKKHSDALQAKEERTFKVLSLQWLEAQPFTDLHREKVVARLKGDCYPLMGNKPVHTIVREDIQAVADVIIARDSIDTAHRVIAWLGKIFEDAYFRRLTPVDPTVGILKRLPRAIRESHKAVVEPDQLREVLLKLDASPSQLTVKTAMMLLPHVFVRQMELRFARWKDIDLESGLWILHKSKVKGRSIADPKMADKPKDYIVPLSRQVVEMLAKIKPFTCNSEFVFPGLDSITRPISNGSINVAMKRMGIIETTAHGFRSTARTLLSEKLDIPAFVIEPQMSHSTKGDKYGYQRGSFLAQRRAMVQVWSDYLDQLKVGEPDIASLKAKYEDLCLKFQKM